MGRPRTTVDDLPGDWREIMLACGDEGASAVECRHRLGIAQTAWETLLKDSEEFRVTEKRARDACNVWWERLGRRLAADGGGNSGVWIFNMKNRFGWRDLHQDRDASEDTPSGVDVSVKDARKPNT